MSWKLILPISIISILIVSSLFLSNDKIVDSAPVVTKLNTGVGDGVVDKAKMKAKMKANLSKVDDGVGVDSSVIKPVKSIDVDKSDANAFIKKLPAPNTLNQSQKSSQPITLTQQKKKSVPDSGVFVARDISEIEEMALKEKLATFQMKQRKADHVPLASKDIEFIKSIDPKKSVVGSLSNTKQVSRQSAPPVTIDTIEKDIHLVPPTHHAKKKYLPAFEKILPGFSLKKNPKN